MTGTPAHFVRIRVGGEDFEASIDTLLNYPGSIFEALLSSRWRDGAQDALVFDRDPRRFRVILNFMRTGELVLEDGVSAQGARQEADFFQVDAAVEAANARGADLVLADTAGRLQTKTNLMDELSKVRRVAEKGAGTVTETLLVIDATTGQNGMSQAKQFAEAVDVTGVVLTKLDGSAKGGIVVAIHDELGVPVKLVGLGEGINDLVEFDESEFVGALFE